MSQRTPPRAPSPRLFDEPFPCITALVEVGGQVRIKAGRRTLATLAPSEVQALGLVAGTVWTPELHAQSSGLERARAGVARCLRWLRVADRSTHELRERLLAKGFSRDDAEAALRLLATTKLQSDDALGAATHAKLTQAGASDAKISRVLRAKGLPEVRAQARVGRWNDAQPSEATRALALARAAIAKPGSAETRVRRALGVLARSEYDEETAREAVSQAAREAGVAMPDEGQ